MCRSSRKAAGLVTLGVSPAQDTQLPCLQPRRTGDENTVHVPTTTIPNAMMYMYVECGRVDDRHHSQDDGTTHIVHCTLIIN